MNKLASGLLPLVLVFSSVFTLAAEEESVLRIPLPLLKLNLDPHKMEDAYSMSVVLQLYRGLVRYTAEGELVPDLAESWIESADHLKYTFKIRPATFSDGTKLTPEQVRQSFARLFFLDSSMAADINYISGAAEFSKSRNIAKLGIRVLKDNRIEFSLKRASPLFLKQIAAVDCAILPISKFDMELPKSYSGPYKLSSVSSGEIVLKKWRKDKLDSVSPPAAVRYLLNAVNPVDLALLDGVDSIDLNEASKSIQAKLLSRKWMKVVTEVYLENFLVLNPRKISFEVRQRLANGIDSAELLKNLEIEGAHAAYGLVPPGLSGAILHPQTAPGSKSLQHKLKLVITFDEGNKTAENIADYLKLRWQSAQLTVIFNKVPLSELLNKLFKNEGEIIIGRKAVDYPDGFSILGYFRSGNTGNYFHVSDPNIDKALDAVQCDFNDSSRAARYLSLQREILGKYTFVPLFFGTSASGLWGPRLKYVPPHPLGFHTLPLESVEMRL